MLGCLVAAVLTACGCMESAKTARRVFAKWWARLSGELHKDLY